MIETITTTPFDTALAGFRMVDSERATVARFDRVTSSNQYLVAWSEGAIGNLI